MNEYQGYNPEKKQKLTLSDIFARIRAVFQGNIQKNYISEGKFFSEQTQEVEKTVDEYLSEVEGILPSSVFQAMRQAVEQGEWFNVEEPPPVPVGHVRVFRGVKPKAVGTEFFQPPSREDFDEFDAVLLPAVLESRATPDELEKYERFVNRRRGGVDKFCANNFSSARSDKYADGGVAYYVDVPEDKLGSYYVENFNGEFAYAIPNEYYRKNAVLLSVGPNAYKAASELSNSLGN